MFAIWKKSFDKSRQCIQKLRYYFADKNPYRESYGFPSGHVEMWELDHKEGWVLKNWCFWIVVFEKTLESSWDHKEFKEINRKGNQPWMSIERAGAEAEATTLWPHDGKSQLIGKDPDAVKDWKQKEKGAVEDEIVR